MHMVRERCAAVWKRDASQPIAADLWRQRRYFAQRHLGRSLERLAPAVRTTEWPGRCCPEQARRKIAPTCMPAFLPTALREEPI
jgi:hypothetical protein